jgi:hypothetical protein
MATTEMIQTSNEEQQMIFETFGRLQKMLPAVTETDSNEADEFSILLSAIEYIQWLNSALNYNF